MAYAPHTKVSFIGHFGTGGADDPEDIWTFGMNLSGVVAQAAKTPLATAAVAAFYAELQGNDTMNDYSTALHFDTVKVADIGADGKYSADPVSVIASTGGTATGNGGPLPPQIAVVASLGTGQRGRSARGRVFLPGPGNQLGGHSTLMGAPVPGRYAAGVVRIIHALNGAAGGPVVCVASKSGTLDPVTVVRVGRAYDTIRTRRNRLPEQYVPVNV